MEQIKTFLNTIAIYGKPQTVKSYGFWLVKFHEFTRKPIEEVKAEDVANWVNLLKVKYAPKSIALAVAVVKEYLKDYNPHVNTRRIRQPKAQPVNPSEPLTPEEYVSMLTFIPARTREGVRDNLLIRMLYDSGARICEVCQVLKKGEFKDGYAIVGTAKTSDKRFIAYGRDTDTFLQLWLSWGIQWPSVRHCERIVKKYAKLAKIEKKITPHSFRHTKAHMILDNGGTVKDIAEVLGHKDPASSFHYLKENDQEKLIRQRRWVDS